MSFVKEVAKWILSGVNGVIQSIDDKEIERIVEVILEAREYKILLLGTGRSPALAPEDLVLAISGSGTTTTVVAQAEVSKAVGSKVVAVTSYQDSQLANIADEVIVVKGRTKIDQDFDYEKRQITGEYDNAPLGTMFEISVMVFLDSVIAYLMHKLGVTEIDLRKRHANAE